MAHDVLGTGGGSGTARAMLFWPALLLMFTLLGRLMILQPAPAGTRDGRGTSIHVFAPAAKRRRWQDDDDVPRLGSIVNDNDDDVATSKRDATVMDGGDHSGAQMMALKTPTSFRTSREDGADEDDAADDQQERDRLQRLREDFPPSVAVTSQRRMLRRGIAAQGGYALCSERGHNGTAGCNHPCGPKHPECVDGCVCPFPRCVIIEDANNRSRAGAATAAEPTLKCVMNPYDAAIPPTPFNGLVCGDDSWRVYPPRPAAANGTSAPRHRRAASFTTARERLMGTDDPETGDSFRDPLPPISGTDGVEDTAAPFKRLTAWMFPAWKDYPAMSRNATLQWEARFTKEETRPSVEWETPHGNRTWGEYTSYFDANGDYVIEFGCLHAMGGLSGVNPSVAAFDGMDEIYYYGSTMFRHYFETVHPHQGAPIRPEEFLDVDLLLMPVYYRVENNVHAFQRTAAAAMLDRFHFQSRFGRRAMKPGKPYDAVAVARAMIQALPEALKPGIKSHGVSVAHKDVDPRIIVPPPGWNWSTTTSATTPNTASVESNATGGGDKTPAASADESLEQTFRSPVTRKPSYRPTIAAYILTSEERKAPDTYRGFVPLLSDAWMGIIGLNYTALDLINASRNEPRYRLLLKQAGVNVIAYDSATAVERDVMMKKVEELREKMRSTRMCFRRAVVSFQCRGADCRTRMKDVPGRRYRLGFFEQRTEMEWGVSTLLRRRALTCLEVHGRASRGRRQGLAILSYRTTSRRIPQIARLVPKLAETALLGLSKGTITGGYGGTASMFVSIENSRITYNANYIMFLQADVLIGSFGGGLGWVYFMRPGAALVEVTTRIFGCPARRSKIASWFVPSHCEYGGYAAASRVIHFGSTVMGMFGTPLIANQVYSAFLQRGLCAVDLMKQATLALPTSAATGFPDTPVWLAYPELATVSSYLPHYDNHRTFIVPWLLDESVDILLLKVQRLHVTTATYFIDSFNRQQRSAMEASMKRTDYDPRVLHDYVLRGWFRNETDFCELHSDNVDTHVRRR